MCKEIHFKYQDQFGLSSLQTGKISKFVDMCTARFIDIYREIVQHESMVEEHGRTNSAVTLSWIPFLCRFKLVPNSAEFRACLDGYQTMPIRAKVFVPNFSRLFGSYGVARVCCGATPRQKFGERIIRRSSGSAISQHRPNTPLSCLSSSR